MLHLLRSYSDLQVVGLLTVMDERSERVAMHDVRCELVEAQAVSCSLPLWKVMLPNPGNQRLYDSAMEGAVAKMKEEGVEAIAFGDLFLEWIRDYRISRLNGTGIDPVFPLWGECTHALSRKMVNGGLRAKIVSVDSSKLDPSFIGRDYDLSLLQELPEGVDPCGENGEFHTCAYAGPMFSSSIPIALGPTIERAGFIYQDLIQS